LSSRRIGNAHFAQKNYLAAIESYDRSLLEATDPKVTAQRKQALELKRKADADAYLECVHFPPNCASEFP